MPITLLPRATSQVAACSGALIIGFFALRRCEKCKDKKQRKGRRKIAWQ